jgi:hypothetical protein
MGLNLAETFRTLHIAMDNHDSPVNKVTVYTTWFRLQQYLLPLERLFFGIGWFITVTLYDVATILNPTYSVSPSSNPAKNFLLPSALPV